MAAKAGHPFHSHAVHTLIHVAVYAKSLLGYEFMELRSMALGALQLRHEHMPCMPVRSVYGDSGIFGQVAFLADI
jgi:hypothetical protein